MKKFILNLLTVLLAFSLSGYITSYAQYDIGLESVEVPKNRKQTFGKQVIVKSEEKGKTKYTFEDDIIKTTWFVTSSNIYFDLKNKTDHLIKIIWDEAVFVDQNGESHSVMHSGTKYIDRNNPKSPTTIVRNGKISDIVFPSDYVYYQSGKYGGWRELDLIKNYYTTNDPEGDTLVQELAKKEINKTIQVLLPIKIENITNEYIFVFKVKNFKVITRG